jgi:hypothetical protein
MKKKYLVWGAIATIGAILIYNWKKNQDKEDKKNEEVNDVNSGTPKSETVSQQNTSNTSTTNQIPTQYQITREDWDKPTGFTVAQGNEFRGWFNDNYPEMAKAKAFDLDRTGLPDNENIRKAYWKYSGEWKKYLASKSQSSASATQAKLNKDTMDRLYMAWGGNTSAKKATHSKGRDLQVFFEVSGQVLMPYRWSIIFYEYAKGESRPTYTITDGEGKTYQRGNFSFNGSKYDFSATQGTGAGQRAVTSSNLITAINSLTKRSASLA